MALQRVLLMSATAISVCLLSGQALAGKNSDVRVSQLEEKIARLQKKVDSIEANQKSKKTEK
jgi:outer membrane murein-binding lipoprotein Lpp